MKKVVSIILALFLLVLSFSGCSLYEITIEEYEEETNKTITQKSNSNASNTDQNGVLSVPEREVPPKAEQNQIQSAHCYNALSYDQKKIYKTIVSAAKYIIEGNLFLDGRPQKNDVYIAYDAVMDDHPEFFWLTDQIGYGTVDGRVYIYLVYSMAEDEIISAQEKIADKTDSIKSSIYGANDYEKVLSIHDFICNSTTYNASLKDSAIYNIYGVLINGEAVCQGYAETMLYLCNLYGIDAIVVSGKDENGQPHMWNQVKMDGSWYNIDVTFDDAGDGNYRTYFGLSNTLITRDHSFFPTLKSIPVSDDMRGYYNFNIKECTSNDLNFFYKNGCALSENRDDSKEIIINAVVDEIIHQAYTVDFGFVDFTPTKVDREFIESTYNITEYINEINVRLERYQKPPVKLVSYLFVGYSVRLVFELQ